VAYDKAAGEILHSTLHNSIFINPFHPEKWWTDKEVRMSFDKNLFPSEATSWSEFIALCRAAWTEIEMIGLLYAGTSIGFDKEGHYPQPDSCRDILLDFHRKVKFYLEIAQGENEKLSVLAQQLIVKRLLEQFFQLSWRGKENPEMSRLIFEKLSGFLADVKKSLTLPPYPRFAGRFLSFFISESNSLVEEGNDMYDLSLLITPCIVWGRSELLDKLDPAYKSNLKVQLENFLNKVIHRNKKENIVVALCRTLEKTKDPTDLCEERFLPVIKAALAFLLEEYQSQLSEGSQKKITQYSELGRINCQVFI
jgi:hypothetical protein